MPEFDKVYRVDPSTGELVDTGKRVERTPYVPRKTPWYVMTPERQVRAAAWRQARRERHEGYAFQLGQWIGLAMLVFVVHSLWTAFGS